MKIVMASIFVADQAKALAFYTEILGFVKKRDIPMGPFRWLTVVSPQAPEGTELALEPNENPVAQAYQQGLVAQDIPIAAFAVDDIDSEYQRLQKLGVVFRSAPQPFGPITLAIFEDTCGNLIQIFQPETPRT